jgi:hypothetical protein
MGDEAALQQALKTLEIPDNIRVRLVKSKRAPTHSIIVTCRPTQSGQSGVEYTVEYRKSLSMNLLRHEMCHIRLHLMGLPVVQVEGGSQISLSDQVLNTLHEDYYANIMMHSRFPRSFAFLIMRGLSRDHNHHGLHIHDEVEDDMLAWLLQAYVLKLAIFDVLDYRSEAEEIREEIDHLKEEHLELHRYLATIVDCLKRLPPLDKGFRPFTEEEKGSIGKIIETINSVKVAQ